MLVGELIRNKRKEKKLTLKQLAENIGLSYTYLSQIELGDRNASPEILERISKHLFVTLDELMEAAGYTDKKSILERALEFQLRLIETIRELRMQIKYDVNEYIVKNIEINTLLSLPFPERKDIILKNELLRLEEVLNILINLIFDYSNPRKDIEKIEHSLIKVFKFTDELIKLYQDDIRIQESIEIMSLLNDEEKRNLSDLIFEYLSQENDPYFSDFVKYIKEKGIDLYKLFKKLSKKQLQQVFQASISLSNLESYDLSKIVDEIHSLNETSYYTSIIEKSIPSKMNFENKTNDVINLTKILYSEQRVTIDDKLLTKTDKEKALQILKIIFD